jgi:hypothetical protein
MRAAPRSPLCEGRVYDGEHQPAPDLGLGLSLDSQNMDGHTEVGSA